MRCDSPGPPTVVALNDPIVVGLNDPVVALNDPVVTLNLFQGPFSGWHRRLRSNANGADGVFPMASDPAARWILKRVQDDGVGVVEAAVR